MSKNGLDSEAAQDLSEALKTNSTLKDLKYAATRPVSLLSAAADTRI